MSACNCCENPHPSPPVAVEVSSRYVEVAKCGILNPEDGKYHRSKTVTHTYPDAPAITMTSVATQAPDGSCSIDTEGESDPSSYGDTTVSWGSEYSNADLLAFAATLEGYDIGGWPAYLGIADDYIVRLVRSRFRIKHQPTASCYIKVWLRSRFTPEGATAGGDSDILADLPAYEWSGASSGAGSGLCLKDTTLSPAHEGNAWYGEWTDIPAPPANGFTVIEGKWSYIEGVEPEWGSDRDIGINNPFAFGEHP